MLAQRKAEQARDRPAAGVRRRQQPAAGLLGGGGDGEARLHRGVGEAGQGAGHLIQ